MGATSTAGYSPVIIVDTAELTRQLWLRYRKKGIGGSDASVIFSANPYRCKLDLYHEKLSDTVEDELDSLPILVGKALEPVIAAYFAKKTGFEVYKDTNMYAHPVHRHMIADLDYRVRFRDENTGELRDAILEIKTASFFKKDEWENGAVPYAYELQCRHYMAIMNIDTVFVACLYDNNDGGYVTVRIDRDMAIEQFIIEKEMEFWQNHIISRIPPTDDDRSALVLGSLARHLERDGISSAVVEDMGLVEIASEICRLKALAAGHKKQSDDYNIKAKDLMAPLRKAAGMSKKTIFGDYLFTVSQRKDRSCDFDALETAYPRIYEQFVVANPSERISIRQIERRAG